MIYGEDRHLWMLLKNWGRLIGFGGVFGLLFLPLADYAGGNERSFLARLEVAVNQGDVAALQAVAAPTINFRWVKEAAEILGGRPPWRVEKLELPRHNGLPTGEFIAFSRHQVTQSTSDHLYRLENTSTGLRLAEEIPEAETGGWRIRHHQLSVRFDITRRRVLITDRVRIERIEKNTFPVVLLRLNAIYTVHSVQSGGNSVPFRQAGGFLAIEAPRTGRTIYDLTYSAEVPKSGEDYIAENEAALTAYWYPHIARLPVTSQVHVTVPKGWIGIAPGELIGKSAASGETTYVWKNTLPICYLTVAAGKYTVTTRKADGISISAYLLQPNTSRAEQAIVTATGALQWFARHFSSFPYKRYAIVESNVFPAGLECYSFTLMARSLIPHAIVHECAHTWWGGLLPNTYTRTLWNESFAEYSDDLYGRMTGATGLRDFSNPANMGVVRLLFQSVSLMEANNAMHIAHSAVGYGKGSLVLRNLEQMLGIDGMLAAIRRFLRARVPGKPVDWEDFIAAVLQTHGREWKDYFDPWLTRTDLPDLRLDNITVMHEGAKYLLTGNIVQNAPAYWLRIPLVVETQAGKKRYEVTIKSISVPFRLEVDSAPIQLALDPQWEVLRLSHRGKSPDPTIIKFTPE
jgi:hypothetical protein